MKRAAGRIKQTQLSSKILDSRALLVTVIAVFVLQAAWIAVSFRFPMAYDEAYHLPIIQIFSTQLITFYH